jgi:hypothetical protein
MASMATLIVVWVFSGRATMVIDLHSSMVDLRESRNACFSLGFAFPYDRKRLGDYAYRAGTAFFSHSSEGLLFRSTKMILVKDFV